MRVHGRSDRCSDVGWPTGVDRLLDDVKHGLAIIETEERGIAVVRPDGWKHENGNPVLWLLFVSPEARGKGFGKEFVGRIRTKHEHQLPMALACNGSRRESFFGSCGFVLKERLRDGIVMLSHKDIS